MSRKPKTMLDSDIGHFGDLGGGGGRIFNGAKGAR